MKTVIFGCGKIAHRIVKGFEYVKSNELVGFGSKDYDKAKAYAEKYAKPIYGTYEELLNIDDIDAVYIATYNINHYELIKECLLHHKHVICEKPMLSSLEENDELFALAKENNCLLMEAMKAVFLPINIKIKEMINAKAIGEVKYIKASFIRGPHYPESHWIYDLKTGGALKDIGSYCSAIINFLYDENPTVEYKYRNNTDCLADTIGEVIVKYQDRIGHIIVSNELFADSSLEVYGTKGYIKVSDFWKTGSGYYVVDNEKYELNEEMINDFYYEIQHFTDCINKGLSQSPIMSKKASDNILKITK